MKPHRAKGASAKLIGSNTAVRGNLYRVISFNGWTAQPTTRLLCKLSELLDKKAERVLFPLFCDDSHVRSARIERPGVRVSCRARVYRVALSHTSRPGRIMK